MSIFTSHMRSPGTSQVSVGGLGGARRRHGFTGCGTNFTTGTTGLAELLREQPHPAVDIARSKARSDRLVEVARDRFLKAVNDDIGLLQCFLGLFVFVLFAGELGFRDDLGNSDVTGVRGPRRIPLRRRDGLVREPDVQADGRAENADEGVEDASHFLASPRDTV